MVDVVVWANTDGKMKRRQRTAGRELYLMSASSRREI
jgi:hypothetical protein